MPIENFRAAPPSMMDMLARARVEDAQFGAAPASSTDPLGGTSFIPGSGGGDVWDYLRQRGTVPSPDIPENTLAEMVNRMRGAEQGIGREQGSVFLANLGKNLAAPLYHADRAVTSDLERLGGFLGFNKGDVKEITEEEAPIPEPEMENVPGIVDTVQAAVRTEGEPGEKAEEVVRPSKKQSDFISSLFSIDEDEGPGTIRTIASMLIPALIGLVGGHLRSKSLRRAESRAKKAGATLIGAPRESELMLGGFLKGAGIGGQLLLGSKARKAEEKKEQQNSMRDFTLELYASGKLTPELEKAVEEETGLSIAQAKDVFNSMEDLMLDLGVKVASGTASIEERETFFRHTISPLEIAQRKQQNDEPLNAGDKAALSMAGGAKGDILKRKQFQLKLAVEMMMNNIEPERAKEMIIALAGDDDIGGAEGFIQDVTPEEIIEALPAGLQSNPDATAKEMIDLVESKFPHLKGNETIINEINRIFP